MASLTFQNYIFFSGGVQAQINSNAVFIFQKSLNVWKDICLEANHVEAYLMDQIVSFEGREK